MESPETFTDYVLMKHSFAAFLEMKVSGKFCDFTIKFGSRTISVHRNVLAAGIPYFREKLTNQSNEIDLNGIAGSYMDADALESLIEFSYTSTISLTIENVRTLLPAASFLRMDSVIDACCKFIVKRMKPEEVLSMRQYAESVSSSRLLESIDVYVCRHFDDFSACETSLYAPLSFVKELICRDDLQASKEEKVLDFVMKWIQKLPEEREVYLTELLSKVRLALVQPDYLTDCLGEDIIVGSIPCRNILRDARTFHFLPHRRAMISSFETSVRGSVKQRPKGNESWAPGIYAICSLPEKEKSYCSEAEKMCTPAQSLQYFDPVSNEWSIVDVLSFTLHSVTSSLIHCNGKLYFYDSDYIRAYDPPAGGWSSNSGFYVGQRFNAGVAVSKDKLYICGGIAVSSFSPLDTVICFDFQKNCTTTMQNMPFRGTHLGAASLDDELYILGGKDQYGNFLSSVWKYSGARRWVEQPPMQYSRCAMGCAVLDGKIYVYGGMTNLQNVTRTAEVFDPVVNKWVLLAQMRSGLFGFSLVSYNGKLYTVGGKTSSSEIFTSRVDAFDPKSTKWTYCKFLPHPMEFVKAISIEQTPT